MAGSNDNYHHISAKARNKTFTRAIVLVAVRNNSSTRKCLMFDLRCLM